jgi:hypothetical protein
LATQDLTTLSAVREFLQKDVADTGQDAIISSFITRASDAIMAFCEREFKSTATGSTARTFEYRGGGLLSLAPYDLRSVSQIRMDVDEATPTVLDSDEYRLYPYPAPDSVYQAIRLEPYVVSSRGRWEQRLVEVTGVWGFASVPTDVVHACITTVSIWLRRDVSAFESVLSLDQDQLERPAGLPSSAMSILTPYRRQSIT